MKKNNKEKYFHKFDDISKYRHKNKTNLNDILCDVINLHLVMSMKRNFIFKNKWTNNITKQCSS